MQIQISHMQEQVSESLSQRKEEILCEEMRRTVQGMPGQMQVTNPLYA